MPAVQLPLVAAPHRNQQLFSDYYLNTILPGRNDWRLLADDARPLLDQLRARYAAFSPSTSEAQTEDNWIKPVLAALGHTFEVQAALQTPDGTKRPDYVFYRDGAALVANRNKTLNEALLAPGAFAVGDAKAWDRPLDVAIKASADALSNKNPGYQIDFYIRHSGLAWGILTNGRLWRLYHKDTSGKLDRFYEVDLPALLERNDPASFLYFYAFFHRSAFEPHPLSVDALLKASTDYARGVGDTLKQQVYDALRHLAQGFLDYPDNDLQPDAATLKQIYDHSLLVLYRLLFVFYAEARELLPLRASPRYRDGYSLHALVREVASDLAGGNALLPDSNLIWPRLRQLFRTINAGSPPLKVATFNGGLFDPERHSFLERHSVGDYHLQLALDKLARVHGQFIDYRDLAERHLGTVYEGLLEYQLQPIPHEGAWTVDLRNDKGERHRTGSYYTPDFIVQYIVDQTLGPVLRAAVKNKATDAEKVRAVLAVNCCDPAMGSGHFPVAATEYIARFLIEEAITPGADAQGEGDLLYWKRRVAQSCIYGVDLNPLAVELAKLSLWLTTVAKDRPLSFLDHHLRCGNALVGSRVADLAVRASGAGTQRKRRAAAPAEGQLSLLDDADFARSMSTAVDAMWLIEGSAGDTVAEVKEQERVYASLRQSLNRRYGRLADLVAATHFGLRVDATLWQPLADFATGRALAAPAKFSEWLDQAEAMANAQRFFHWDLEFPEVFFNRHGQPLGERAGFDAVIGNPPYVRQEQLGPLKPYLADAYAATYHGAADLYVFFYQQGLQLLRQGGRMSYIVTNKWLRAGYGETLRAFFAKQGALEQIVDFGHAPIFADADVFPCIVVVERPEQADHTLIGGKSNGANGADAATVQVTSFPREALGLVQLDGYVRRYGHAVPRSRFTHAPWSLETSEIDDLMAKIRECGVPLAEFADAKPYRGVLTGLNEAFLIDTPTKEALVKSDPRSAEIIKPYLRGQDIKRWSPEWDGLWMIFARRGIDIDAYSAVKQHLQQFRAQLEPQPKGWSSGKWQGRKQGAYKWYEIQDSVDYWPIFTQPKIVYQVIQFYPQYALDTTGVFHNDKGFSLPTSDPWLLAVLNSPLLWWQNWRYLPHMKDEALTPLGFLMEQLPIASPSDATRTEVEPAVARLIAITQANQEARRDTLDWLRSEFGVETAGQKLDAFAQLDEAAFVDEVRKRRAKSAGTLSPSALKGLKYGYAEQATPVRERQAEAQGLERRLAMLVNEAYGLTPEDVETLWRTAPPRMPVGEQKATK